MADQENTQKEFRGCCEGMPFADMMRKMTEAKKTGHPVNCAEMMSQMMQMCCEARESKEKPTQETEKSSVPDG
jgi:CTP synthase (UTP-ammonia lyase)